tara:strand:+ start:24182 stop:25489 length:1308 start_codon:yes stop_codon:yes gene_type:complete
MQAISMHFGGQVETAEKREYGPARIKSNTRNRLFIGCGELGDGSNQLEVWMSHADTVIDLPQDFKVIASSRNAPMAGIANDERKIYGLQFHPEVTHTPDGATIIQNFAIDICGCSPTWTSNRIIEDIIEEVKVTVGSDRVLLGLSGGVDSSVVAALLHRAIGSQLICVFVDNGLLRLGEAESVMTVFKEHLGVRVIKVNASDRFLSELQGISDPEEKRKTIGRVFVEVFQEQATLLTDIKWLAQGTIYPDIIESAGAPGTSTKTIKSHHNVGGLPDSLNLKLLEPLAKLFKDEVRDIGTQLSLPSDMINRHPFPGPGLAVRILGEVTSEYVTVLQKVDSVFIDELKQMRLYDTISQAFAVFLPIRSVGVVGDERSYEYVVALRAVETTDFMTANWSRLPHEFLDTVSRRIINEVRGISRVTYDISSKPPATIEWE